jgi:hypothetical protein
LADAFRWKAVSIPFTFVHFEKHLDLIPAPLEAVSGAVDITSDVNSNVFLAVPSELGAVDITRFQQQRECLC